MMRTPLHDYLSDNFNILHSSSMVVTELIKQSSDEFERGLPPKASIVAGFVLFWIAFDYLP